METERRKSAAFTLKVERFMDGKGETKFEKGKHKEYFISLVRITLVNFENHDEVFNVIDFPDTQCAKAFIAGMAVTGQTLEGGEVYV
jgi:hypothetical protein